MLPLKTSVIEELTGRNNGFCFALFRRAGRQACPPFLGGGAFGNVAGAIPAGGPLKRERPQVRLGRSLYISTGFLALFLPSQADLSRRLEEEV